MKTITITLTDAEYKALQVIAISPEDWVDNLTKDRARIAIDEIVAGVVKTKLDNGEPIIGTREEIVLDADIETASERETKIQSEIKR